MFGEHFLGYASKRYAALEDLAEAADWTGPKGSPEAEKALQDYLDALHAMAAMRTYGIDDDNRYDNSRGALAEQAFTERLDAAA